MCSFVTLPLETWVKDWVDKVSGPRGSTHLCRSVKVLVSILSVFQLPLASCSFLKITALLCMTCAHMFCLPQTLSPLLPTVLYPPHLLAFPNIRVLLDNPALSGLRWGMPIQCSWFFIVVISSKLAVFRSTRFWPLVWLGQFCLG